MRVTIHKGTAKGIFKAPASKSMSHRLLIAGGLASGHSRISGLAYSEDILATMDCLRTAGCDILQEDDTVSLSGFDGRTRSPRPLYPCRESGSTLRFFLPIAAALGGESVFTGSRKLMSRPLGVYETIFREQHILFERSDEIIRIRGQLQPADFFIPGDISSQFISGLLFALPLLQGDSILRILPPFESRPYVDMTIDALRIFGVTVLWQDDYTLRIPGGQEYREAAAEVEGDYSNAAFFEALNVLGGSVRITGLSPDTLQGDAVYQHFFRRLSEGPAEISLTDCPDLGPVLFTLAAALSGGAFTGIRRLAFKESDRIRAMQEELSKFGAVMKTGDDRLEIADTELHQPAETLYGHQDHRIVMALSVLLTRFGGSIEGAEAVSKSFPDFFSRLSELGIEVEQSGL